MAVSEVADDSISWFAEVGEELNPTGSSILTRFAQPRIFLDANDKPVVMARYGSSTHLWFGN